MTKFARGLVAALTLATAGFAGLNCSSSTGGGPPPADAAGTVAFTPDPPSVYVAKVKNILVGLAPTDAEIASVTADPNTLGTLIDEWMALPQYQDKMKVFFELAFQQTQITATDFADVILANGIGTGIGTPLVTQNAEESFARTMLAMTAQNQPFTNAFSTQQVMMTPALMELYAYMDARRVDDNGKIIDDFALANPTLKITVESSAGPILMSDTLNPTSPNYMHFYDPQLATATYANTACPTGIDPISFKATSTNLNELLYGEIPIFPAPTGTGNCNARGAANIGQQMLPSDFTTWKLVTIRPPMTGEATTTFYDLPTLRTTNTLVLNTKHLGFFSTPAFAANWPTNPSNQMRVTMNQALIVATGTQIDGNDATAPATTPGLDASHAAPGSECFRCHQLLDPMRSILASNYTWFYSKQGDQTEIAQPGLFAFEGVIAPMQTLEDFTSILSTHPLVAQAWVQKLCFYVNSSPCDLGDPEFKRIVADFANGYSWNKLVHELMASPITTNVSATTTSMVNGEVIGVARRDHLCAALNNRLGFIDICGRDKTVTTRGSEIIQIVGGLPSDGYGRGGVAPVLPNQPTLFYRGGLENICESVATQVIDATPNPAQPGVKQWVSTDPDTAIGEFVSLVMGLTTTDPRTAPVTAALQAHFAAAQQTGATKTASLRSTFVVACLSPSFIGIGM